MEISSVNNNKIHYFYVILKIGKPLQGYFIRFREKKKFAVFSNHPLDTQNHAKFPRLLSFYLYLNVQQVLKRIAGSKMQLFTEENKEWFPNKHHEKAS